jgi:hypothetical protein
MTRLNAKRRKQDGTEPPASPPDHGTAPLLAEGSEAAPIWATARVDQAAETVRHQDGSIAVGSDVATAHGDAGKGSAD